MESHNMKRSILLIGAGVVLVGLLAAGIYTAVRLLAAPPEELDTAGGGRVIQSVRVENDGAPVGVRTTILPAQELPKEKSVAFGILIQQQDDNLIIGTGNIDLEVDVEVNGDTGQEQVSAIPSTDGPELEVVLTRDTLLYQDVTDFASSQPDESGEQVIQQQVKQVDTVDKISEHAEIEVWGERRGDRIVATVLVFGPLGGGQFE
jgi:hypothetical protein